MVESSLASEAFRFGFPTSAPTGQESAVWNYSRDVSCIEHNPWNDGSSHPVRKVGDLRLKSDLHLFE